MIFVWVEFQRQFPVSLFKIVFSGIFVHSQYLVIVFTLLYPEK